MSRNSVGGTGMRSTYSDNLLVDERNAQSLSIYDYVAMAREYVDTVRAVLPVFNVTFYGVDLCNPEIHPASANMQEYALIGISFDYDNNDREVVINGKSKLFSI